MALLQESLRLVAASDASLRSRITLKEGEPVQYYGEASTQPFEVLDFSMTDREGVRHWEALATRELMPLLDSPLYRFVIFRSGEHSGGVLVKTHHIISDGWSQVSLCNRIARTYLELLSGSPVTLKAAPDYRLHIEDEKRYLASPAFEQDKEYWEKTLAGPLCPGSVKEYPGAELSPIGQRRTFQLSQLLNHAIYAFCTRNRVAPFAVFYMALAIYLRRMGGRERFAVGVPIYNRANLTDKATTGIFVSTLPFYNELDENWSFSEFNRQLGEQWFDLLRHQRFPFDNIAELAKKDGRQPGRLFHLALSYQNSKIFENRDASALFTGRWHYSGYQAEHICIHVSDLWDHRRYSVDYDYLTQLFSEQEIGQLHHYLTNILTEALENPDKPIREISILGKGEKEEVLYRFNHTARPIYRSNLYGAFARTAVEQPEKTALIRNGERCSYGELSRAGARYAAAVEAACPGGRRLVAVLLPKSFELMAAMVGIMQSGNAWVLLPPELPEQRVAEILRGSGAELVISRAEYVEKYGLQEYPVALVDDDEAAIAAAGRIALPAGAAALTEPENGYYQAKPEDLAYVVYTSGSSGLPKGVEIGQLSLLNFAEAMGPLYGRGAALSLCSVNFDAFLIESAAALLNGRTVVFPDEAQQEDPAALARLITGYAVGFLSLTPSRLSALLRDPDFTNSLKNLEVILCGGEHFPGELLQQLKLHTRARIYNQYGPSETTVGVSCRLLNDCSEITVGTPMDNCRLYVLDDYLQPLPVGARGELYVGGVCVGRGYRNAPELTAQSFVDSPFEPGERLYRTGDLAAWTEAGEVLLFGRKDRQLKLRGLRVEPAEIAAAIARHPLVKEAAVKEFTYSGQLLLAAYYTADVEIPETELLSFAAACLPPYMIPACLQRIEAIPLTANGKTDLQRLPEPALREGTAAADTALQETLLSIFRQVLGRADMGADGDYFLYGGDSLNGMETIARIEEAAGLRLRVADLYACRNVRRLEQHILLMQGGGVPGGRVSDGSSDSGNGSGGAVLDRIPAAPVAGSYPLSPAQQSIYVQTRIGGGLLYNMPGAFYLGEDIDRERLEGAFRALIAAEEVFRTGFIIEGNQVRQKLWEAVPFALPVLEAAGLEEAKESFVRPFEMEQPPLLRAALWRRPGAGNAAIGTDEGRDEPGGWVLLVDMHHIISDGLSTPLILKALDAAYRGEALPKHPVSYKDYACWAQGRRDQLTDQWRYWEETLKPLPEDLELPTDRPRPHVFDFSGGLRSFTLGPALSARCDEFCRQRQRSPYALFAGVFGLLLSKLSGREEFLIGTPVSGRSRPELRELCGLFINTLPLKITAGETQQLDRYLESLQGRITEMLDHQELPLEEIVSGLGLPRSLAKSPLYQVMFSMRPLDAGALSLNGQPVEYLPFHTGSSKMELSLEAARENGKEGTVYNFHMEYATAIFQADTIELYTRCFKALLAEVVEEGSGSKELAAFSALDPLDRFALIDRPLRTRTPYADLPLDALADQTARLRPQDPAIIFKGRTLTYEEVRRQSDALAAWLLEKGARPEIPVAFTGARTPALALSMLAILKAGCTYMPIMDSFPASRIRYMLENVGAEIFLCDRAAAGKLPADLNCELVSIEEGIAAGLPFRPPGGRSSRDSIHVLYTSGSTGEPKGALLPHRALSNLLPGVAALILDRAKGPLLCTTNLIFDTFITETLFPLALGKTIVFADEEEMMLPWKIAQLVREHGIKLIELTPSRIQVCLENREFAEMLKDLDVIMLPGEAVSGRLVEQLKSLSDAAIFNLYGPTETAVYVTATELYAGEPVVLGRTLPNCRVYVLDPELRPVLPTAVGEFYVAGECLGQGYVNNPERTAATFLPDPFFPGETMYKTGDIGRMRANGDFEFMCRRDNQIKLNGLRIELDEISGQIQRSGLVGQEAVIAVDKGGGFLEIRGFVTAPEGGAAPDLRELYAFLRKELPSYMVPSCIKLLPTLPYLPSGKLDRQTLAALPVEEAEASPCEAANEPIPEPIPAPVAEPEMVAEPVVAPEIAPAAEAILEPISAPVAEPETAPTADPAETLTRIWKDVLQREQIDPGLSFFDQGGTSLLAMGVLSYYFNNHFSMTLAQFYEHPTLQEQIAILAPETQNASPAGEHTGSPLQGEGQISPSEDRVAAGEHMGSPLQDASHIDHASTPQTLLTGATGFLGAHLLKALLDAGAEAVTCLTRDGSRQRLSDTLAWFFGQGWVDFQSSRIRVCQGDVRLPLFGMTPADYQTLAASTELVLHAAADVRHYANDPELLKTNRDGVASVIAFARAADCSLHHISTISVSGDYIKVAPKAAALFSEEDFDIGQNWADNVYVQGKFLAEKQIYEAMKDGLKAKIFRIGRLVGRSSDGVFQRNAESNAFFQLIQGMQAMKMIPASAADYTVDLTPVDVCANAVVALGRAPEAGPAFHVYDPNPVTLGELARQLVPGLQILPDLEFEERLAKMLQGGAQLALASVVDLWNRLKSTPAKIHPVQKKTVAAWTAAGVAWPKTPPATLLRQFRL